MSRRTGQIRLAESAAIVTGAARGIGRATVETLLARGSRVGLLDTDVAELERMASALDTERVLALPCDVRDLAAVSAAVEATVERFGRLDVVVANAGIAPPTATLRVVEPKAFERVLDVNVLGAWHTARASLEHVIHARGHVSFISSCAAFTPGMGGAAYIMSKAAVEQLGRALTIELAPHGASAGLVSFGIVDTPMATGTLDDDELARQIGALLPWPLNRRISPEQAAEVICDSIERRQAARIATWVWQPYAWLRGMVNPLLDASLARSRRVGDLLLQIEQRERNAP